jgi:hypothetical protein
MNTIVKNVPVWNRQTKASAAVDVDLEIDAYNVARILAQRAYENKSGKSNALRNSVTVTVRR